MRVQRAGRLVGEHEVGAGGLGNFLSYGLFLLLLGPLETPLGGPDSVWRWSFVILAVPALLVVFYRRKLPETPRDVAIAASPSSST